MRAKITVLVTILLIASFSLVVFAQESAEDAVEEVNDCEVAKESIDKKVEMYLAKEPDHTLTYQILWLKVAALARKADVYDLDTSDIYKNLEELDELTEEFTKNFDAFIKILTNTKKYVCSTNEVLYVNSLKQTKETLDDLRKTAKDITYLYNEKIRGNILALQENSND